MAIKHGRQWGKTLEDIRDDHKQRYQTACDFAVLDNLKTASDVGSGIGYGAYMLAQAGLFVDAYEIDSLSIEYGEIHYHHEYLHRNQSDIVSDGLMYHGDLAVSFEFIEHVSRPEDVLLQLSGGFKWLICSVPNELVIPFSQNKHHEHKRHYTPDEFRDLLKVSGWEVFMMGGQKGKHGENARVQFETVEDCRTLVAIAKRQE